MNTGREVASGRLWSKKGENQKVRVRVVLHCGSPDSSHHGQLSIFNEGVAGNKPLRLIPLHLVHNVQCLNTTYPSPITSKKMGGFDQDKPTSVWGFMLLLQTGEGVELFAEAKEEQQLWIQHLNLLSMFPYSPIPEEPRVCPIKDSFRSRLGATKFNADSAWAVYILPEEVGSRIRGLGLQFITLQSSLSKQSPALFQIISPVDMEPIVTWEASKMRRTGSLGNMMFIEIGRRCEGGPGLIWMCTVPTDTQSLKETLHRFIFSGDGRPVGNCSSRQADQVTYSYDRMTMLSRQSSSSNRSSICSGSSSFSISSSSPSTQPSSSTRSSGVYEDTYDYAQTTESGPPITKPRSLPLDSPPPVNLTTHPSRRHKRCVSNPGDMKTTSGLLTPNLLGRQKSPSKDSGFTEDNETFEHINESLSNLVNELEFMSESPAATPAATTPSDALADLDKEIIKLNIAATPPLVRRHSLPGGAKMTKTKRANSTSTCQPTHYLKMKHNRNAPPQQDEYVFMQPAPKSNTVNAPPSKSIETDDTLTNISSRNDLPNRRQNYDQLTPIVEDSNSDCYENFPLPKEVAEADPIIYQPTYQNFSLDEVAPRLNLNHKDKNIPSNINKDSIDMYTSSSEVEKREEKFQSVWDEIDNLESVLAEFN